MFTGLIEEIGVLSAIERNGDSARFTVRGPLVVADAAHGDSISVSGVCLTVVDRDDTSFTADVMQQSLAMSIFDDIAEGRAVNLERAAGVGTRLGGHIVQGHIDGTARVVGRNDGEAWRVLRFTLDDPHAPLVVAKGSITVDGVSLTVSDVSEPGVADGWFEVSLIPETLTATTLGSLTIGDNVNLETDILARHVERLVAFRDEEGTA